MERLRAVALLTLFASPAFGIELTERQKQAIGQLIVPKAGGFTVQVLGGTAEPPFLTVSGTLPASPAATVTGGNLQITGSGSASQTQRGFNVDLLAGYTGSSNTLAGRVVNASAGTGNNLVGGQGNFGLQGAAIGSTAGLNVGLLGNAEAGGTSVAVRGAAIVASSGNNIGGAFFAANSGAGGAVGLYVGGQTSGTPSGADLPSAIAILNNSATAVPLLVCRDSSATVCQIEDGGTISTAQHYKGTGTAPGVSACGSSPSITGSDVAGKVTAGGGGAVTSCTLTFATAYAAAPACMVNNETTAQLMRAVTTTTTLTIDGVDFQSDVVSYLCIEGS